MNLCVHWLLRKLRRLPVSEAEIHLLPVLAAAEMETITASDESIKIACDDSSSLQVPQNK